MLVSLDRLRQDLAQAKYPSGLNETVQAFATKTETRILALMAEIQRHDRLHQMLGSVAQMVGDIGKLDLNLIIRSSEEAAKPRQIIDAEAEHYVTAEQRFTHRNALSIGGKTEGPDLELF